MLLKKRIMIATIGFFCLIPSAFGITDSVLDNRAKNLPYEQGQSVNDIVKNLTHDLTDDKSKARVLATFVAYQLQRNGYAEREIEKASRNNKPAEKLPTNNLLKTRIGTSQEFASLYHQLCQTAGLESAVIIGYAGKNVKSPDRNAPPEVQVLRTTMKQLTGLQDYRMQRYEASWNAVKINQEWALVDTYMMIAGNASFGDNIRSESAFERLLKRRERQGVSLRELTSGKRIDDDYFDAKPRQFVNTHYPLDEQWQLLPVPVSWRSFVN